MAAGLFVKTQEGEALRSCRDLVRLRTERRIQLIDLSALVAERVLRSRVSEGIVNVQSRHATAALAMTGNEPRRLGDLAVLLERRTGVGASPSELRTLALGPSVCLNVAEGKMDLGDGQGIFLVELSGPAPRTLSVQVLGMPGVEPGRFGRGMRSASEGVSSREARPGGRRARGR